MQTAAAKHCEEPYSLAMIMLFASCSVHNTKASLMNIQTAAGPCAGAQRECSFYR